MGHDEYLYHVVKGHLPPEAWVRAFNPYDLYSKSPVRPDRKTLEPYYRELVSEFFPEPLRF